MQRRLIAVNVNAGC